MLEKQFIRILCCFYQYLDQVKLVLNFFLYFKEKVLFKILKLNECENSNNIDKGIMGIFKSKKRKK